jgi:hypothetical protein
MSTAISQRVGWSKVVRIAQLDTELVVDPDDQLRSYERVAAELEEVVDILPSR